MKIDLEKGYNISANDKSSVYKALNLLYPNERIKLIESLTSKSEISEDFVGKYITK